MTNPSDTLTIGIAIKNGTLIKAGSGTLDLSATGTYAGGTTLNAGTLRLGISDGAGTGTLTLAAGTIASNSTSARTPTNAISITGDVTLGELVGGTGTLTLSGATTYTGNRNLTVNANMTFSGTFSGSGVLTRTGVGAATTTIGTAAVGLGGLTNTGSGGLLTVSGPLTLTGDVTASASSGITISNTVNLSGAARSFTGDGAGTTTVSGAISNGEIVKSGTHTLILSSATSTFTGGVTINNGLLQLGNASALNATALNPVAMTGGTLRLTSFSPTIADLNGSAGTVENSHASTASTLTVAKALGTSTFAGSIQNGGVATLALTKSGGGTLTLAGTNTHTGVTTVNGGTLILDYSGGGNTADPLSTGTVTLDGGKLILKGKSSGTTTETIGTFNMGANLAEASTLTLAVNGGSGVNLTVTSFSMNTTAGNTQNTNLIDMSSSAGNSVTITGVSAGNGTTNGVFMANIASNPRANLIVKDSTGYGFSTLSGGTTGTLGRLSSGFTRMTASNASNAVNYLLTAAETTGGTLTRTATASFSTLTIDTDAGGNSSPITLAMGTSSFAPTGNGRAVLLTGANDLNMTGSTGTITSGSGTSLWIHNHATGALNIGLNMPTTDASIVYGGPGFTNWSGTLAATGAHHLYFETGLVRLSGAQDLTTGSGLTTDYFVSSGGVLEIGADLNGTAGDFTNAIGSGVGQVRFIGDSGVSAYGANRVANFGGVALTWGSGSFLTNPGTTSGDGNNTLKLSSAKSNATIELQNPLALGVRNRVIDVANGSAGTDAILSGTVSSTGGGIIKMGDGTLSLTAGNTYTGNTVVSAGHLQSTNLTNGTNTTVAANAQLTADTIRQNTLALQGTTGQNLGLTILRSSGGTEAGDPTKVSQVQILTIDGAGSTFYATLDLKNNDLVVNSGVLSDITAMIRSGRGTATGLEWNGTGIRSSEAASGTYAGKTALGVRRNIVDPNLSLSIANPAAYPIFDGLTLPGNEILVKYTWYGDFNLDGQITSLDYALLDAGMVGATQADGQAGWFFGDANLDGVVNLSDYTLLTTGATGFSSNSNTALPEPSTLVLGVLAIVGLLAAKRRP